MLAPNYAKQQDKIATVHVLDSIDFTISSIAGTGSLSPRARRVLGIYLVLVKRGYNWLAAPIGAIAGVMGRATCGEASSIRTVQRANAELETAGYVRRARCRTGKFANGALLELNLDAFAFWTRRESGNVIPYPTNSHNVVSRETMCDKSSHTTTCRPSDRTSNHSRVNSQNTVENSDNKPRAGARASQKTYRDRRNAILLSLGIVLGKTPMRRADRRAARARADVEVKSQDAGVELLNPSGVDWDYWEQRWPEFSIPVRENTIRKEILPRLLPALRKHRQSAPPPSVAEKDVVTPDELRAVRDFLSQSSDESSDESSSSSPSIPEITLDRESLELLSVAREKARRIGGID